ncbi:hypothetical protein WJX81_004450 [Elliptochloris bilobata]|uniref:Uncharacterized protein n=1 Tax=Elliptochloris bilobata TaxID=381761 RepID=A0AAW1R1P4_9CHLO
MTRSAAGRGSVGLRGRNASNPPRHPLGGNPLEGSPHSQLQVPRAWCRAPLEVWVGGLRLTSCAARSAQVTVRARTSIACRI